MPTIAHRHAVFTAAYLVLLGLAATDARPALAQSADVTTAFIYQGQLTYQGAAVTGKVDLVFSLWDASNLGNQIGSLYAVNNADVVGGLFSTTLDFGAAAFTGGRRWLEVSVRYTGTLEYVTLAPRQPLAAVPYSLQTRGLSIDGNDTMYFTTNPNQIVATMSAVSFNMAIYAPTIINNSLTIAPTAAVPTALFIKQPTDAEFLVMKIRAAAFGTEDPPMRDFNLFISAPVDSGGTRKNRVMTFGYNNSTEGFPEYDDAFTLCDRWESNWYVNGHNYFERHIQYVSINPEHYLQMYRPLSVFINKDQDIIQTDLNADAVSINDATGDTQYFKFTPLNLYCLNGARVTYADLGAKTLISSISLTGNFADVLRIDAADRILLGSPAFNHSVDVTNGDLNVSDGNLNVAAGDVNIASADHGLRMTEGGPAARVGVVTLNAGTATVMTTAVTANSRIFLTPQQDGSVTAGYMRVSSRAPGFAFVITSSKSTDNSAVAWFIIEPN